MAKTLLNNSAVSIPARPAQVAATADAGVLSIQLAEHEKKLAAKVIVTRVVDSQTVRVRSHKRPDTYTLTEAEYDTLQPEINALLDKVWDLMKTAGATDF
jgi:PHD/YefM family antitoxin component YafN of YafNO toxin-antitoxin module